MEYGYRCWHMRFTPFTYCHSAMRLSSFGVTSQPAQANVSVSTCFLPSCCAADETCRGASSVPILRPSQSTPGMLSYS